jgi:hypothetical protein
MICCFTNPSRMKVLGGGDVFHDLGTGPAIGPGLEVPCFGAGVGGDGGAVESGGDGWRGVAGGAEVVGEGLSLLREDLAHEGEKSGLVEAKFGEARGESPAEDGGVDVGRRREGGGREREQAVRRGRRVAR